MLNGVYVNVQLSECSLKLYVVVDTESTRDDMIPVHGLSLLLEVQSPKVFFRMLFGLGPSHSALINNLMRLGYRLSDIDIIVLPMDSRGLIGSFREIMKEISSVTLLSSPNVKVNFLTKNVVKVFNTTQISDCCLILSPLGPRGELVLVVNTKLGLVLIIPCSHVGVVNVIKHVVSELKVKSVYGIVGGLHLSAYDVLTLNDLRSLSEDLNVRVIIPLYCTGIEARDKVLKLLKESYIHNIEVGCVLEYRF